MQKTNLRNVAAQAIKPRRFAVIAKKAMRRLVDKHGNLTIAQNREWLRDNCIPFRELARQLDPDLWRRSQEEAAHIQTHAEEVLRNVKFNLGGGGIYPFLYFLTRMRKPQTIVETGIAAGYSSYAFLKAIADNGCGHLYSSDFPYFRLPNPERFIGIVVPQELKADWTFMLNGDESNLPKILAQLDSVDFFHYDSDRSYSGRTFAMHAVTPKLHDASMVMMDKIEANSFFHDYVLEHQPVSWFVLEFEGKYIGMIGKL